MLQGEGPKVPSTAYEINLPEGPQAGELSLNSI